MSLPPRKGPELLLRSQGNQGRPGGHPEGGRDQQPPPAGGDARGGDGCQHFSLVLHAEVEGRSQLARPRGQRCPVWREAPPSLTPFSVTGPKKELNFELREKLVTFVQTLGITRDHTAFLPQTSAGRSEAAGAGHRGRHWGGGPGA